MTFLKKHKARFLLFLAVLGPGLITAVADNDAGGIATYSVAASMFGMASMSFVVLTALLLGITQETGARIGIVTGKGLGDLIREKFGARVAVVIFVLYFFVNQGVVLQNVSGLKAALQLFNLPWQTSLILACFLLIILVIKLNYKNLQRVFLVTILFYGTYVVSAFLAKPDWGQAFKNSLLFGQKEQLVNPFYWFTIIAVLGTTVTAWCQFFVNSYIADKGIKPEQLKEEKAEVYLGAIVTHFFSWMIAVAVTYTLFVHGIKVVDGFSATVAIRPLAGNLAYMLFATGLFAASFLGLTIVPLATAYGFTEFFGYERTLNASFMKGKTFYIFFIIQILLGLVISLFPRVNLFKLTLYADFFNGAMLPVIFYFLIRFSEDAEIMGQAYVSKGFSKWFIRAASIVIGLAVAASFFGRFLSRFF
ncbi:MAG: divalent metal cation transporter [Candidatus Doudnabacteria bacterium]|nr:divalent metal cation transporter [Candidatus Doudnabacteria bacterium]